MAKLRAAKSYRRVKRAYVRTSKLRNKAYVKGAPNIRLAQYDTGNPNQNYTHEIQVISTRTIQVRDNALEAGRQTAVRYLEVHLAKEGYRMKTRAVPHHILRENPLATGAGADRFSQGMAHSFGSPYGHAAQVKPGRIIYTFRVFKHQIPFAKEAARKASTKMPMHCMIKVFDMSTGKEIVA